MVTQRIANNGYAEMRLIEEKAFEGKGVVSTFCVDGYKFVTFDDANGISMAQAYEVLIELSKGELYRPEKC